jgi:hypothetical protein
MLANSKIWMISFGIKNKRHFTCEQIKSCANQVPLNGTPSHVSWSHPYNVSATPT